MAHFLRCFNNQEEVESSVKVRDAFNKFTDFFV